MANEETKYDIEGFDLVTSALLDLVNSFPGLDDEVIGFATLDAENGIAMFPSSGAVVRVERESVTGNVHQECLYPFSVYYRAVGLTENRKIRVKEFLDNLGRWLEKQLIVIDDTGYVIKDYPPISGERKITKIARTSPAYQIQANNSVEDWGISLQAHYTNDFERS